MAAKKKKAAKKQKQRSGGGSAAEQIVAVLQKKYGKSAVTTLSREAMAVAQIKEFLPTGIDVLDHYVIGRGGLPIGRMCEVFGEEGCGKTALLYRALGSCQRQGGVAALLDAEYSFDDERAEVHGIDQRALIMEQPSHLEQALDMIKDTCRAHNPKNGPLLIGLDSLASLKTKSGISLESADAKEFRGEAQVLSNHMRDLPRILTAHRAHLFIVNQIRHKPGVMFGNNTTTPGGNAPKFYCSVRLQFFGGKAVKNKHDEHIGKVVTVMAIKNRLQAPFMKARVRFDFATGYNDMYTTVEHAKKLKLIKPRKVDGKQEPLEELYLDALEEIGWPYNEFNRRVNTEDVDLVKEEERDEDEDDEE